MTSRTHDIFAVASLLTIAVISPPNNLNLATLIISIIGCLVAAMLPDLDQATKRLWSIFTTMLPHRTLSHSFLGIGIFYLIVGVVMPKLLNGQSLTINVIVFSLMTGYVSHIMLDAFTEEGVPLLFPIKFKFGFPPFSKWRIRTGGFAEKYIIYSGLIIYLFWFSYNHRDQILKILETIHK